MILQCSLFYFLMGKPKATIPIQYLIKDKASLDYRSNSLKIMKKEIQKNIRITLFSLTVCLPCSKVVFPYI